MQSAFDSGQFYLTNANAYAQFQWSLNLIKITLKIEQFFISFKFVSLWFLFNTQRFEIISTNNFESESKLNQMKFDIRKILANGMVSQYTQTGRTEIYTSKYREGYSNFFFQILHLRSNRNHLSKMADEQLPVGPLEQPNTTSILWNRTSSMFSLFLLLFRGDSCTRHAQFVA